MGKCITSSFTITLMLCDNDLSTKMLKKRFYHAEIIYNQTIRHIKKQYSKMLLNPNYKNSSGKDRTVIIKDYGLTKYQLYGYVKIIGKKYKHTLDSKVVQCIAEDAYTSLYKLLYGKGKRVYYKKRGCMTTISTNTNFNRLHVYNDKLYFNDLEIKIRNKSLQSEYIQEALKNKIKYCRIKKLPFNNRNRYYVQLIIESTPPKKHEVSKGDVGIDIGTSTIAVSSGKEVILEELAPLNNKYVKQISKIQRAMDRSKRNMNPQNYNENGTIKKGRLVWVYSNGYKKLRQKSKALYRKRSAYIKQSHEIMANRILSLGNNIFVETMTFAGLAKRSKKPTEVNVNGKCKKKKRFGKAIQSRAPASLISIIDRKLIYINKNIHKINTKTFKASQYNHITNTYNKKELSTRGQLINDKWIQRDLYSSFLLMNSLDTLEHTDIDKCNKTYNNFIKLHDKCINEIKQSNISHPTSFGF